MIWHNIKLERDAMRAHLKPLPRRRRKHQLHAGVSTYLAPQLVARISLLDLDGPLRPSSRGGLGRLIIGVGAYALP